MHHQWRLFQKVPKKTEIFIPRPQGKLFIFDKSTRPEESYKAYKGLKSLKGPKKPKNLESIRPIEPKRPKGPKEPKEPLDKPLTVKNHW